MAQRTKSSSETIEFTYDWYRSFLDRITSAGYAFGSFSEPVDSGTVFLRHDVDLSLQKALQMALIETERGIKATYCILLSSGLYNPFEGEHRDHIRAIESLGHDLVVHFSPHEYWDSDAEPAEAELEDRINEEHTALGTIAAGSSETVSFHRPPAWILNRPLERWRNTYAPAYYGDISYHADSGQRWRENPPRIPELGEAAQVLVHPGLWGERDAGFEERVRRSVTNACRHMDRKAHREYLPVEGQGR